MMRGECRRRGPKACRNHMVPYGDVSDEREDCRVGPCSVGAERVSDIG
ncbi:MAG: hypothetical protein KIG18_06700 [Candidatus Methanomethylophilaceae archaeon]|nr:hypothetical protein [Candidatus Methanomethylophilaceae archaeon]